MYYFLLIAVLLLSAPLSAQTPDEQLRTGLVALQSNNLPDALSALQQAKDVASNDVRVRLALAETYRLLDRPQDAEQETTAVAKMAEENPALLRGLSIYFENAGDAAEAARIESSYTQYFPDDLSGFGRAATFYLEAGDASNAAEFAMSGLERREMASLYEILAAAQAQLGRDQEAAEAFRGAIRLKPYDEGIRYHLAYLSLRRQDFDQGLQVLDEARELFDKSPRIELARGTALYGLRRFDEAIESFLKAARLAPGAAQPHYFLGRMIEHSGDRLVDILERQRAFAEAQPDSYLGSFLYGQALLASLPPSDDPAAYEQSAQVLRRSVELKKDYWESHFELGQALERQKRYEEAQTELERAVELNPQSSKPQYRLSRVYTRLGKTELAEAARKKHAELTETEREAIGSGLTPLAQP
ncbi:MAG: tetratricopeptide repeat protein [Acidobacteria bacterium]|nr:tetratricopeptide repeat protein [Acidobacteriota bacterium]